MPKASAADTSASSRLSVSNWQTTRRRDAPIASRMPISRWRATARASSRLATLAQPISRIRPNAKKSGMNEQHDVGRQRDRALPRFEHEARGRPLDRAFSRTPRVPHKELRERLTARQAGLQPPDNVEADGVFASLLARRNWPSRESGAQKSGATTVSPRKPSGITPTTWNGAPFTRTVRLSTPGSLPKCRDQARWLRTMAGRPPGSSSDGVNVRPSAGLAPSTWKKFPVTSGALQPRALDPAVDVRRPRECIGEDTRLADERFIPRAREALGLLVRRSLTFDREQLVRVDAPRRRER